MKHSKDIIIELAHLYSGTMFVFYLWLPHNYAYIYSRLSRKVYNNIYLHVL